MKTKFFILICFFGVLAMIPLETVLAGTITLPPIHDADLLQSGPDSVSNTNEILIQSNYHVIYGGQNWRGILMFDLSSIPAGATIIGSSLKAYMTNPPIYGARNWQLWFCNNDSWNEETVTWNTQPDMTALIDTIPTLDEDGYMTWGKNGANPSSEGLTAQTITEFGGDKKLTLLVKDSLEDENNATWAYLRSKEWADSSYHPALIIDYTLPGPEIDIKPCYTCTNCEIDENGDFIDFPGANWEPCEDMPSMNLYAGGLVAVALLGFDVATIDSILSAVFWLELPEPNHHTTEYIRYSIEDVNHDGAMDLVFHFSVAELKPEYKISPAVVCPGWLHCEIALTGGGSFDQNFSQDVRVFTAGNDKPKKAKK